MKSSVTKEFRKRLDQLPQALQQQAGKTDRVCRSDPYQRALINHIRDFLLELGLGFAF